MQGEGRRRAASCFLGRCSRVGRHSIGLAATLTPSAKREGEVIIHVPPPYRERGPESDVPGASMARRPDGLLSVRLALPQGALFTVFFDG
jgi:hypothetical protein